MYLSLYCKVWKGYLGFYCERELETDQKLQYFDPHFYGRQRCVFLVLLMLNRRPRGPPCWVMAFFTTSYQHLPQTSTHQGPKPLRPGVTLPTTTRPAPSPTLNGTVWLLSWLSYIIVPRPLNRLLDLWNRTLDRCQAEITVMQFRGHSLSVRQTMNVPWEFFTSSHFISQFPPTRFLLISAIRMCHFLPVHQSEWHFCLGRRSKYNKGTSTWQASPFEAGKLINMIGR